MLTVLISGSPSEQSRSRELLSYSKEILIRNDITVVEYSVRDFSVENLVYANYSDPSIQNFIQHIAAANGLIVSTPIYKASLSGVLKVLLDILPQNALENKAVLPLATAGSLAHLLAVDYALKPVLGALKASEILAGVVALDHELSIKNKVHIEVGLKERLDESCIQFLSALHRFEYSIPPDFII